MKVQEQCKIMGCRYDVVARGWCNRHYRKWKHSGNPRYKTAKPIKKRKTYCIYLHTNKTNGKQYVGYTCNYKRRCSQERSAAFNKKSERYNSLISRAIRKYGWNGFTHMVLEEYSSKKKALDAEDVWIQLFKCDISRYGKHAGYNMRPGGQGLPRITPKTRAKLRAIHRKHSLTDEQIREIRKSDLSNIALGKQYGVSDATIGRHRPKPTPAQLRHRRRASQLGSRRCWKLTPKQVQEIRRSTLSNGKLAEIYEVGRSTIAKYRDKPTSEQVRLRRSKHADSRRKLTLKQILCIRSISLEKGSPHTKESLAKEFDVNKHTITNVRRKGYRLPSQ